jgi:hypothetical protein
MEAIIIQQKIFEIRREKMMLDFDLAFLYGVETKAINQSVKRNIDRFPATLYFNSMKMNTKS